MASYPNLDARYNDSMLAKNCNEIFLVCMQADKRLNAILTQYPDMTIEFDTFELDGKILFTVKNANGGVSASFDLMSQSMRIEVEPIGKEKFDDFEINSTVSYCIELDPDVGGENKRKLPADVEAKPKSKSTSLNNATVFLPPTVQRSLSSTVH